MKRLIIVALLLALLIPAVSASTCPTFAADGDSWVCTHSGDGHTVRMWNSTASIYSFIIPTGVTSVWYTVVGAGAGGSFGGGAGGGVLNGTLAVIPGASVNVGVGKGGLGSTTSQLYRGKSGQASNFSTINVVNSSGGGADSGTETHVLSGFDTGGTYTSPDVGVALGGFLGSVGNGAEVGTGGGGGGAGANGGAPNSTHAGDGGRGNISAITGTNTYYGGAGGGGTFGANFGLGGLGGGGNGGTSSVNGDSGLNGLGGGGGGAARRQAGDGGSGVVLISYTVGPAAVASFTQNKTSGVYPLTVEFVDTSTHTYPIVYNWTINSVVYAQTQNMTRPFSSGGNYTVNLTINDGISNFSATGYVEVFNQTTAAFSANTTSGVSPLPVGFTDSSSNATAWYWDFGDGNTSVLQNPSHLYEVVGTFNVNMKSNNSVYHSDWENKTAYISVYCAEFSGTPTTGSLPLLVAFTDLSTGSPTAWNWSFGDGAYSELQNPTHTYTSIGSYTVRLTSTIGGDDCSATKLNYIHVGYTGIPAVDFTANKTIGASPFAVQFADSITQAPTSWNWSFGGDGYSDDQNPIHTFTTPGTYWINLTATNPLGSGTLNKTAYITVLPEGTTIVDFAGTPTSGEPGLLVQFTDLSVVTNTSSLVYNWSFGDGTYSDIIGNPQHVYAYTSVYDVNLTITNNVSAEFEEKTQYITVSSRGSTTWYNPHDVTITVFSMYGQPLEEVSVSANYNETTLPTAWLTAYYGLQGSVASDALNATLVMSGYTGRDGAITYTMIKGIKYDFVLNSATYGITNYEVYEYTSDSYINFYVDTSTFTLPISRNSTYADINTTRIYVVEPDLYNVSMCIDFQDTSGRTSSVTDRWIFKNNNTEMNATTFVPGIALNTHCYTIPNVRGTEVWWGWNATRLGV